MRTRKIWTPAELKILKRRYPHERTDDVAKDLGRPLPNVYSKANNLGLSKTAKYLASPEACRLRRADNPGVPFRYARGHVPANKGLRRPGYAPGRMAETQFKKGQWPRNKDPDFYVIGALRVNSDGYIDMRTSFAHGSSGWRPLHRILWEDAHGPIPKGFVLTFRDRDKLNVELANLELLSFADNMRRNTIHNLPASLKVTILALGNLKRAIKRRTRREEQDRRSA